MPRLPVSNGPRRTGKVIARKGSELSDVACAYVRERPLVAVAGALAFGYLVGRMLAKVAAGYAKAGVPSRFATAPRLCSV